VVPANPRPCCVVNPKTSSNHHRPSRLASTNKNQANIHHTNGTSYSHSALSALCQKLYLAFETENKTMYLIVSVPTSINRPVREDVFFTIQFEDNSKLSFPCSVSIPFIVMAVFCLAEDFDKADVNGFCWPKYMNIWIVNGRITDHGKHSFEWSSNWTVEKTSPRIWSVKKTSSRTGRLRKRLLELDGQENVFSNWTVKKRSSRAGRLRKRLLELDG